MTYVHSPEELDRDTEYVYFLYLLQCIISARSDAETNQLKIYLVNLDRSPDRLTRMSRLLQTARLTYHRIPAIDGHTLSAEEIEKYNGNVANAPLSGSQIGCYLSHRAAWQQVTEDEAAYAAIIEDDIHFSDAMPEFLGATNWIPTDADIIKFETVKRKTTLNRRWIKVKNGYSLAQLVGLHCGTGGYIVSLKAAKHLLDNSGEPTMPIDQLIFNPKSDVRQALRIYQMVPALCMQDSVQLARSDGNFLDSGIQRGNKPTRSIMFKIRRESHRLGHQISTAISGSRLNIVSNKVNMHVPFGGNR